MRRHEAVALAATIIEARPDLRVEIVYDPNVAAPEKSYGVAYTPAATGVVPVGVFYEIHQDNHGRPLMSVTHP
jgi:hypothetical protein